MLVVIPNLLLARSLVSLLVITARTLQLCLCSTMKFLVLVVLVVLATLCMIASAQVIVPTSGEYY